MSTVTIGQAHFMGRHGHKMETSISGLQGTRYIYIYIYCGIVMTYGVIEFGQGWFR